MSAGSAITATGVTVSIARDPALVRTVRLVAAAVARRTGQDEELVEEIRLAVGEACALLIGEEPDGADFPVTIAIDLSDRISVEVVSDSPVGVKDPPHGEIDGVEHGEIDGVERWALLRGLVDNFRVEQAGPTTTVSMSWPIS